MEFWIPSNLDESVPWNRGWDDHICSSLVEMHASAFLDRADRIEVKKDIIRYLEDDSDPSHDVVESIVNGSEDLIVPNKLSKSLSEAWYLTDDLSVGTIKEMQSTDSTRLSQKEWSKRYQAIRSVHESHPEHVTRGMVEQWMRVCFDLGHEQAANRADDYETRYDIEWIHPVEAADVEDFDPVEIPNSHLSEFNLVGEEKAMFVDKFLKYFEVVEEETTVGLTEVAEVLYDCGICDDARPETAAETIDRLDQKYGLTHLKQVDSKIYLSTYF